MRSVTRDAAVDSDSPFTVAIPTPNDVVIEGAGWDKGANSDQQVSIHHLCGR